MRAVALIDGEHYPPVVHDALAALPYEWVGAILVGGTEKLRGDFDYGVPLVEGFDGAEVVLLGGNQLGEVREHAYPAACVLGYRWPEDRTS